jgi:DNA-binding MarR family transcriptional regulator
MPKDRHTAEGLLERMGKNWPEAVTPVTGLMMRVYRLSGLVLENARQQTARHGLGFTAFEVLVALRSTPPPHELAPTELYRLVLISSGGLTKVLRGLEGRGLVARVEHEADRRSRPVRLTAAGRALAERAMADVLEADDELLSGGLSLGEIACLTTLVRKLLLVLESDGPEGASSARTA